MELPVEEGTELILALLTKERDRRLWDLYASLYPWMDKEHFQTFEQFSDKMTGGNISTTPAHEILERARKIREGVGG